MKVLCLSFSFLFILCLTSVAQQARFDEVNTYSEATGADLEFVGTGDINGDGLTDIAGMTGYSSVVKNPRTLFVWLQGTNGKLLAPIKSSYGSFTAGAFAVNDIYNDGTAEIVAGIGNYVCIYSVINNSIVLQDSLYITGFKADGIAIDDFDGDSLADIGVSHAGGNLLTIIYQNGEAQSKWDIKHYFLITDKNNHLTAGKFGPLQQTALIHVNGGGTGTTTTQVTTMTFDTARAMQNKYDMAIATYWPSGAVVVNKGGGQQNELWVTYGGNKPYSRVAIWKGLQTMADTEIMTYDIPGAIQSADLDCDDGDEPVVLHIAWARVTVFIDSQAKYKIPQTQNRNQESLSLGDVNNDGRIDICIGSDYGLVVMYNNTIPCGTTGVSNQLYIEKELTVFPNPANNDVNISYSGGGKYQITDMQGRVVYSGPFYNNETVDVSNWVTGTYFIKLHCESGQILRGKLFKN